MSFRSRLSDVHIPGEVPFPRFLLSKAWQYPDRKALVDISSNQFLTYQQLQRKIKHLSDILRQCGVRKGDIICLCSVNCMEYFVVMYAVMEAGAIITTLNPDYTKREMLLQMQHSKPRIIFTISECLNRILQICRETPDIKEVILFDKVIGKYEGPTVRGFTELMKTKLSGHQRDVCIKPQTDVCILPYSSGTTGLPKGVMLTHYNMVASTCQASHPDLNMYKSHETVVVVAPMYHMYGIQVQSGPALYNGSTLVIMRRFNLSSLLSVINDYKVSVLHVVPPVVLMLANLDHLSRDGYDGHCNLTSVHTVLTAGSDLGPSVRRTFKAKYPYIKICVGYGLSEVSGLCHITPVDTETASFSGSLCPNMECKIVDTSSGRLLSCGERGEVMLRGPIVMIGYLRNEAATTKALDVDGWFHTGDIGFCDKDQNIQIVDRMKELIKYNAYQVAPAELEAVLVSHPDILDAAVVGKPDSSAGELPTGFVVLKQGSKLTQQQISDFVKEQVVHYKRLRGGVIFVERIPKSDSGKILRRLLRDPLIKAAKL